MTAVNYRLPNSKTQVLSVNVALSLAIVVMAAALASAQEQSPVDSPRKANARPVDPNAPLPEPFDHAPVEKMAGQCVTLETEAGTMVIEMLPEVAPESVRNF